MSPMEFRMAENLNNKVDPDVLHFKNQTKKLTPISRYKI